MTILLGAVADDFTGATDLASTLVGQGMPTVQTIGLPDPDLDLGGAEAVVVALKSRTAPVDDAVGRSLEALDWLLDRGARQIVFKYCSTFDSTPQGNIGPVADAMMERLDSRVAVVCPAYPGGGRTVYKGHLFVGDQLLAESPMKDHPLTPMRDSSLVRLMAAQSRLPVRLVDLAVVRQGAEAVKRALDALAAEGPCYAVVDAVTDDDLDTLGRAVAEHRLVTGGAGVARGLPANLRAATGAGPPVAPSAPDITGRAAVLAGSCSVATRGQIARFSAGHPAFRLDPDRIARGEDVAGEALAWARGAEGPVLIYASADPDEVRAVHERHGRERAGAMIEDTMGRIAVGLVGQGVRRLVVAGGETSGAVVSALGIPALEIGPPIAVGVPWTTTLGNPRLALALKSGNFGGPDFFDDALDMLP